MSECHKWLSYHQLDGQEDWQQLVCLAQKQAVSMDLHSSMDVLIHELAMALSETSSCLSPLGNKVMLSLRLRSCLHS